MMASLLAIFVVMTFIQSFSCRLHSTTSIACKKILFLGTPQVSAYCLEHLTKQFALNPKYAIVAVATQPPAPAGRSMKVTKSPVHNVADKYGIQVLHPEKASETSFLEQVNELDIDLCITAAYGNYLPRKFLAIPKFGTVNIHPSLLPKYRGAAPVQRCLAAGDKVTGVSLLFSTMKMDAGPIIGQRHYPLQGDEKAPDLMRDLFAIGSELLLERLASICEGDVAVCPQTESEATEAPKITQSESIIDFNKMTAFEVHNHVRAFAEWPGSWATFTSNSGLHRVKLITTQLLPQVDSNNEEDDILKVKLIKSKNCIQIRCQDGAYIGVSEVQPEHRKVMDAKSFWNGLRGELLYRQ